MTTTLKIAKIQNSITLQHRIKKNIEASTLSLSGVDGLDTGLMLSKCDEIIAMLEARIHAIPRRVAKMLEARTETLEIIAKAKSYQPKFWDLNLISTYEAHVAKLNEMLAK